MGEGWEGIAASSGENNFVGSCETHHVSGRQEEDRGRHTPTLGEVQGGEEEGGLEPAAYVFLTA
jgi:hypothetical protein